MAATATAETGTRATRAGGDDPGPAPRAGRSRRARTLRSVVIGLAFVAPSFLVLGWFMYYPAYVALVGAFTDWDGFNTASFVGLENFREAFADPALRTAAVNNVLWALGKIALSIIPPFVVAELIFHVRGQRWQYLYRTLFVIPLIIPVVVNILLWTFYYRTDGLVNQAFDAIGPGRAAAGVAGAAEHRAGRAGVHGLPVGRAVQPAGALRGAAEHPRGDPRRGRGRRRGRPAPRPPHRHAAAAAAVQPAADARR